MTARFSQRCRYVPVLLLCTFCWLAAAATSARIEPSYRVTSVTGLVHTAAPTSKARLVKKRDQLLPGDTVRVAGVARCEIALSGRDTLRLNEDSRVVLGAVTPRSTWTDGECNLALLQGEAYVRAPDSVAGVSYSYRFPLGTLRTSTARMAMEYDSLRSYFALKVLSGVVTVRIQGLPDVRVAACSLFVHNGRTRSLTVGRIPHDAIDALAAWMPLADTAALRGAAAPMQRFTFNASAPADRNVAVIPTVTVSPETTMTGTVLLFEALPPAEMSGPVGVRWDFDDNQEWDYPADGHFVQDMRVRHTWALPGRYAVVAQVRDGAGNVVSMQKNPILAEPLAIDSLLMPEAVGLEVPALFECRKLFSVDTALSYTWDFDGNGSADTATRSPTVQHSFATKGAFAVTCTVSDSYGRHVVKQGKITVGNAPTLVEARGLYRVQVNTPLSVGGYVRELDNKILSYSWDFDNDGKYEWSSSRDSRAQHIYPKAGAYTIRLVVKTDDGAVTYDSSTVDVYNLPPRAYAGEDVVSRKGKKVLLMGAGRDPDGTIVKYEWDFSGDGIFDYSSPDTGYVVHVFEEFSRPISRVTDSDGETASDTMRVVICPDGMIPVKEGKFCIDEYESPNASGTIPQQSVTIEDAEASCGAAGKRLCSAQEWEMACAGGPTGRRTTYPYGNMFQPDNCNTLGNSWVSNQIAASGQFGNCAGRNGVSDMSGNVAEWIVDGDTHKAYAAGGSWQSTGQDSKCTSRVALDRDRTYFYVGFRCCK